MGAFLDGSDGCKESQKKVFNRYFQQRINAKTPQQAAKHALHFRRRKYKRASKKAREEDSDKTPKGRLTFALSYDEPDREARSLMIQFLNSAGGSKAAQLMGLAPLAGPWRGRQRQRASSP
eukprot:3530202-Pyramimonas_sp.AAC.1